MTLKKAKQLLANKLGNRERTILNAPDAKVYPIFNYSFDAWRVESGKRYFEFALRNGDYQIIG